MKIIYKTWIFYLLSPISDKYQNKLKTILKMIVSLSILDLETRVWDILYGHPERNNPGVWV